MARAPARVHDGTRGAGRALPCGARRERRAVRRPAIDSSCCRAPAAIMRGACDRCWRRSMRPSRWRPLKPIARSSRRCRQGRGSRATTPTCTATGAGARQRTRRRSERSTRRSAAANPGRMLVVGAGAGRLAYDVHARRRPATLVAADLNPLMMIVARRMFSGGRVELYEFPVAPRDLASHAVLRDLRAPCTGGPGPAPGDRRRIPGAVRDRRLRHRDHAVADRRPRRGSRDVRGATEPVAPARRSLGQQRVALLRSIRIRYAATRSDELREPARARPASSTSRSGRNACRTSHRRQAGTAAWRAW